MDLRICLLLAFGVSDILSQSPAPTAPTIPASPTCSGTQRPITVAYLKKKGSGSPQPFPGLSLGQCNDICKTSKDPTGKDTPCAGFDYNSGSKTCNIYGNVDPASISDDPSTDFYQKVCVDSNEICSSAMQFEVSPQKILIGFARQVVQSPTVNDCLKQCLDSYISAGFECQSAMYYPVDQSCILNTENRYKRPDLFVDESVDQVLYFDNNCAGSVCASSYVVQYTKSMDITPKDLEGHKVPGVSLYSCQTLCTDNIGNPGMGSYNCKSFTYSSDKTCTLYDDRILPLGRANFTATPGADYYEKGCYRAQETCRNVPAFTRVPQMVLVGFAAFVIDGVPSVSQCLDACLKPPDQVTQANAQFKCMSVMYYYSEQECILNTETRQTKPDLFIPEQSGYQEDYFDIMCLEGQEKCPEGTIPTTFEIKDTMLVVANQSNVVKSGASGDPKSCAQQCLDLAPQKCRSFNSKGGSCDLLMVNGDTEVVQPSPGTDFYQLICLPTDNLGACSNNPAAFLVSTAKINRVGGGGGGGGSSSRRRKIRQASGPSGSPAPTGAKKTLGDKDAPVSVPDCMVACLKETSFSCQGFDYNILNGKCELFDQPGQLSDDPNTDFYMSACAGNATGPSGAPGIQTICNFDGLKVVYNKDSPFSGAIFAKMKYDTCRTEVKDATSAELLLGFPNSNCGGNSGGCLGNQQPASGYGSPPSGGYGGGGSSGGYGGGSPAGGSGGYGSGSAQQTGGSCTQGQGSGCAGRAKRQGSYGGGQPSQPSGYGGQPAPPPAQPSGGYGAQPPAQNSGYGQPAGPLKPPQSTGPGKIFGPPTLPPHDCGVVDLKNGTYKATIIVQTNNLGIPGLVTSMDAIYEVSCDYSAFLAKKIDATANLHVEGPTPSLIQPRGKVDLNSPVMMQLMGGFGTPILQAKLGDILELRWEMMALDDQMDFFVKECTAERGGPVAGNPGLGGCNGGGCGGGGGSGGGGGYGSGGGGGNPSCGAGGSCGAARYRRQAYGGSPAPSSGSYGNPSPPSGSYGGGNTGGSNCGSPGGCSLSGGPNLGGSGCGSPGGCGGPSPGGSACSTPGGCGQSTGGSGCSSPGGCGAGGQPSGGYGGGSSSGSGCSQPGGCQLSGGNAGNTGGCGAGGCGGAAAGGGAAGGCAGGGCKLVGGKPGLDPNKLRLIEKGCPTPAVSQKIMPGPVKKESNKVKTAQIQAFRFDGSRSVRIICQLDICKGKCNPTTCPIGGGNQESWGKKKRDVRDNGIKILTPTDAEFEEELSHYETEHYRVPKRSHAISSFVVIDPAEDLNLVSPSSQYRSVQNISEHSYTNTNDVEIESIKNSKLCLPKSTFLAVFLFLGILALIQAVAVTICLAMRFSAKKKE